MILSKRLKQVLALVLSLTVLTSLAIPVAADADTRPFLSLGKEQSDQERQTVLELLGVDPDNLDDYNVLYVSNQDEHDYLSSYMSESLIGTRALSSVLIVPTEEGTGIQVTCQNINYCTPGMYRNALITAGITDANVKVAAPFNLPGTAALVGAMKSYEAMTGEPLSDESKDAATNELIVTGDVGDSIGDMEKAEELMALVKQEVVEKDANDENEIGDVVDKAADALEVQLSDEDRQLIIDLMKKIADLDLNIDSIKQQAQDLYDKLSDINIDTGFFASIGQFFSDLWNAIVEFFTNLFGGGGDASSQVSSEPVSSEASSETESQAESSNAAEQDDTSSKQESSRPASSAAPSKAPVAEEPTSSSGDETPSKAPVQSEEPVSSQNAEQQTEVSSQAAA
ncbi:DUF1002 domain-containing protein [Solibaculum mannosilyticum]|uniref:DUF1002 domain-containing protein n=1 Tax=Solibaculum mannosilyticum TaxID=2780922 RepID=UPI0034B76C32